MNTSTRMPANRLSLLARDAHDLAMHVRALERHVADAADVPACRLASEAADRLGQLEALLTSLDR